jgi:hypothetical protein
MFEKLTDMAETTANAVSRRAFLGRLSQASLALAGALASLLAFPGAVEANGGCCLYVCSPNCGNVVLCLKKVKGKCGPPTIPDPGCPTQTQLPCHLEGTSNCGC